ncbi:MAG: BamA/TamA family outer membrane protein [Bacteroidales bacterium]|nr:BamA/TamA family outer membrane protein [Bacteroidales bacterium]
MKRIILIALSLMLAIGARAQKEGEIVKTGLNFGPLPAIAFDADKGFQYGALLQIFNYGNGENYPNYNSKMYMEYSRFTKGSQLIQFRYDDKTLIPGTRWSNAFRATIDKAYDFYGFNGYGTNFDPAQMNPFYRYSRYEYLFKSDVIGKISNNLNWVAGLYASYYKLGSIDYASINKGKAEADKFPTDMPTLYDAYVESGVISAKEADGGFSLGARLGVEYDTRDKEGAPTRGIWADAHVVLAPVSEVPFYRYSATWRQYFPLVENDVLTFAYRLNYEGTFGSQAPFYALSYISVVGEQIDKEGMGGSDTGRGLMRCRVIGLDTASYVAELRWRFTRFTLWNQNIAFALNAFSDGVMVTRGFDLSKLPDNLKSVFPAAPEDVTLKNGAEERPHVTAGGGLRFIMNENFIVRAEYGLPISKFAKEESALRGQDGSGSLYIGLGYLF